jgi:hypothetical protein
MQYSWHVLPRPNSPYARRAWTDPDGTQHGQLMHNLIMGFIGVDHEDHDGLNNQRFNLRRATPLQQQFNKRSKRGSTSRYKGVCWVTEKKKWKVQMSIGGRVTCLGYFTDELEAAQAYAEAALKHHGEFACASPLITA